MADIFDIFDGEEDRRRRGGRDVTPDECFHDADRRIIARQAQRARLETTMRTILAATAMGETPDIDLIHRLAKQALGD